jgi:hypothetical protein
VRLLRRRSAAAAAAAAAAADDCRGRLERSQWPGHGAGAAEVTDGGRGLRATTVLCASVCARAELEGVLKEWPGMGDSNRHFREILWTAILAHAKGRPPAQTRGQTGFCKQLPKHQRARQRSIVSLSCGHAASCTHKGEVIRFGAPPVHRATPLHAAPSRPAALSRTSDLTLRPGRAGT